MKLVENPQVKQPNKSQVIKVKSVPSFRGVFRTQSKILAFVYWIAKKAPSLMFNLVLNTHTPGVDDEGTRTISITLLWCFCCWLWINFVQWLSCIFNMFQKFMFLLFWASKRHLGRVSKIEKNRWLNVFLKFSIRKIFGIKNLLQITTMIQE